MNPIKTSELRELTSEELVQKHSALKKELFDLRMQAAVGKLDKPHQLRLVRRDVARLSTLLKEKQPDKKPAGSSAGQKE